MLYARRNKNNEDNLDANNDSVIDILNGETFSASLVPTTTCTYDFGSSSKYWNNLFGCKLFIDDSLFNLDVVSSNPTVTFDTGDNYSFVRATNIGTWNIASNPILNLLAGAVDIPSTSTLQTDTIVESTAANGVTVEGVGFKDSLVNGALSPLTDKTFTLGDLTHRWDYALLERGSTGSQVIVTNTTANLPDASADNVVKFGVNLGKLASDGDSSCYLGSDSVNGVTTADAIVSVGHGNLNAQTTNGSHTVVGVECGPSSTGVQQTLYGYRAGFALTTAPYSAYFGYLAGQSNLTGIGQSSFGRQAGSNATGNYGSFMGYNSGWNVGSGVGCTILGANADTVGVQTESIAIGLTAVAQNSYDCQLGQRTDGGSGQLSFRTQICSDEAWITTPVVPAVIDASGNLVKEDTSGAVTQITTIATTVVLNARIGLITTVSSTLAANGEAVFQCTNNKVLATGDLVRVWINTYAGGSTGLPTVYCDVIAVGSFKVVLRNAHSTGALGGVLKIGFEIINV